MSVYVDPLMPCVPNPQWRWSTSSHLFADTSTELHRFAARIGMKRHWASDYTQPESRLLHYDLNAGGRRRAVALGAIEVARREAAEKFKELREAKPSCPRCKKNQRVHAQGDREWWCADCRVKFDMSSDGGTYSDDPTYRAERQDEREHRRQLRLAGMGRR